jgi:hypothetical protein
MGFSLIFCYPFASDSSFCHPICLSKRGGTPKDTPITNCYLKRKIIFLAPGELVPASRDSNNAFAAIIFLSAYAIGSMGPGKNRLKLRWRVGEITLVRCIYDYWH